MHQDNRVGFAFGDESGCDYGLTKARWCDQDASVESQQVADGVLLFGVECTLELEFGRSSRTALVLQREQDPM
mgnify:CR=1 FL=1